VVSVTCWSGSSSAIRNAPLTNAEANEIRDGIYLAVLDRPDDADPTSCTWLAGGADSVTLTCPLPIPAPRPRAPITGRTLRPRGAVNLRDQGDYPTASGGRTLRDRIYRSGELRGLGPRAIAAFKRRGARGVVDLRTHSEQPWSPATTP
jgi:hypothetical protein